MCTPEEALQKFGFTLDDFDEYDVVTLQTSNGSRTAGNRVYKFVRDNGDDIEVHLIGAYFTKSGDQGGVSPAIYDPWDPFGVQVADLYYNYDSLNDGTDVYFRPTKIGMKIVGVGSDNDIAEVIMGYKIRGQIYEVTSNSSTLVNQSGSISMTCRCTQVVDGKQATATNYNTTRGVKKDTAVGQLALKVKFKDGTSTDTAIKDVEPK